MIAFVTACVPSIDITVEIGCIERWCLSPSLTVSKLSLHDTAFDPAYDEHEERRTGSIVLAWD